MESRRVFSYFVRGSCEAKCTLWLPAVNRACQARRFSHDPLTSFLMRFTIGSHIPIGFMGLVDLPTWMVDLYGKCRILWDFGGMDNMKITTAICGKHPKTLKLNHQDLVVKVFAGSRMSWPSPQFWCVWQFAKLTAWWTRVFQVCIMPKKAVQFWQRHLGTAAICNPSKMPE